MTDLLQYVEKYDPSPPDFVGKMIEEGVCNKNVKGNPNTMDYVEKAALKKRQAEYYKNNAVLVLRRILPKFELPI
jgi:hypothetical protein